MRADISMDDTIAAEECFSIDIIMPGGSDECVCQAQCISVIEGCVDGRQVVCWRVVHKDAVQTIQIPGG